MRVVIAGSSGLIGTALVSSLRSDNHDVVRLVRRSTAGPDESRWDPDHDRLDLSVLQAPTRREPLRRRHRRQTVVGFLQASDP